MNLVNVLVDVPLNKGFTYASTTNLVVGSRVLVEFKRKKVVGFVWQNNILPNTLDCDIKKIKPIIEIYPEILDLQLIDLVNFVGKYYHYPAGQTLFNCLPPHLRKVKPFGTHSVKPAKSVTTLSSTLDLNAEQKMIVNTISSHFRTFYPSVLYGITGSGKTEVYLELIKKALDQDLQALVLVPEINLTPQLVARFSQRFSVGLIQVLTSNATEKARAVGYIGALDGQKKIIIGTRLALFTPFKNLGLIIVDEEHDQSFKQNEGLRYHARDIAVWRASYVKIPIVLGSATPALETLYNYKVKKYALHKLSNRAVTNAKLPQISLVDLNIGRVRNGLSEIALQALQTRIHARELSLVFINRRGYAPIVSCYDCGWVSSCTHCSTNLVYHSITQQLKCHHCGFSTCVPSACPKCDNQYLQTIGQGTQKIEQELQLNFPQARIYRIDQDTVSTKRQWDELYNKIHRHEIDILVGTQMLAKGHDFANLTLVVGVNSDNSLYSHDFRAPELLFTQLTQVAGRAGRGDKPGLMLLQTNYPEHELYQYLIKHDFVGFANYLLKQRRQLQLPPYSHYVMLRASADLLTTAIEYLSKIYQVALNLKPQGIVIYSPVPAVLQKLKNRERAQMLIMSEKRQALHEFLSLLVSEISEFKAKHDISWLLDIDPIEL